jgi:hypothetical protein
MRIAPEKTPAVALRELASELRRYSAMKNCPQDTQNHMREAAVRLDRYADVDDLDTKDPALLESLKVANIYIDAARAIERAEADLKRDLWRSYWPKARESARERIELRAKYFLVAMALLMLFMAAKFLGWI